ncbi:MAG: fosfomycin resistance glutathione transferase [Turicibacter sp.]|nr:fosfomycin resistance glutathione transferase [Turicibacter sp.]
MLTGINHLTLAVTDLRRSVQFYQQLPGMVLKAKWERGAYFECGGLWLCLSLDKTRKFWEPEASDYTHYAFSIAEKDFEGFQSLLEQAGVIIWKINKSEGKSCYFLDPDGHKLEAHVGGLQERLEACRLKPYDGMVFYP